MAEPEKMITVTYEDTDRFVAFMNLEEARAAFGLGGTPDDLVAARVRTLIRHSGGPGAFPALRNYSGYDQTMRTTLVSITEGMSE